MSMWGKLQRGSGKYAKKYRGQTGKTGRWKLDGYIGGISTEGEIRNRHYTRKYTKKDLLTCL